jgi:putative DNA methylase
VFANFSYRTLASSIVLVCRPRFADAPKVTRREFVTALKGELPIALTHLQRGNIAPVDMAQAAIGPGMAVYTRFAAVLEADGSTLKTRTALQIINESLDAILSAVDTGYDADTRWALKWFDLFGNENGPSGDANTLANATNVGVDGLVEAGIVIARGSKVRLLRRSELHGGTPLDWDPTKDKNIPAWEAVQHIIHRHQEQGVDGAAALVAILGARADVAKDLAYRLYNICDRKKWQAEALAYNALVAEWNDIVQASTKSAKPEAGSLFG